ncbi:GntR-family transcriptional regulator [Bifidobacterium tsurumiense]|uniref:GntR-family transcriptional regulator n=3 Tax=Bifidobacterium tsurumiense TaxID=356829 RepID=A0A087EK34_9BIFI|nr:GntR-family transcriptional regulator [Bifidobacterium tsurumiense]
MYAIIEISIHTFDEMTADEMTLRNVAQTGSPSLQSHRNADEDSLHNRLLNEWGTAIVNGDIPTGERMPEPSAELGNPSRTVTREVTRVLEYMGLVSVKRKAGATVNPPEDWNLFDPQVIAWRLRGPNRAAVLHELSELRNAVEPTAARLAAQRSQGQDWSALTEAAIDMVAHSHEANGAEYLDADMRFHTALLNASGNSMFIALGGVITSTLQGRTEHELMPAIADPQALRLHGDVAAYIRQGNAQAAQAAMRAIVDESEDAIAQLTRQ